MKTKLRKIELKGVETINDTTYKIMRDDQGYYLRTERKGVRTDFIDRYSSIPFVIYEIDEFIEQAKAKQQDRPISPATDEELVALGW